MEQRKRPFIRDFGFLPWTKNPRAQAVNEERRQKNIRMFTIIIGAVCPVRNPVYSGPATPHIPVTTVPVPCRNIYLDFCFWLLKTFFILFLSGPFPSGSGILLFKR
jgi:hypothetical protein